MTAKGRLELDWVGELLAGEHIQWRGRPCRGLLPLAQNDLAVAFAWVWLVLTLPLFLFALTTPNGGNIEGKIVVVLVSAAFLAFGVYLTVWQIVSDAFLRCYTHYALSNFRAFIGIDVFGKRWLHVYPINPFSWLKLDETYAGGTVWFEKFLHENVEGEGDTEPWKVRVVTDGEISRRIGFVGIPDSRDVYARMRQIQALMT